MKHQRLVAMAPHILEREGEVIEKVGEGFHRELEVVVKAKVEGGSDGKLEEVEKHKQEGEGVPPELFHFIASKTPNHDLAWDVGTGSGQAARSLAGIYKNVIATDTSPKQLEFAPSLPNVRYQHTSSHMSIPELEQNVAAQTSMDLINVAQALHWFDIPTFYQQAKWVLKKPHGVIAAWCYTLPEVNERLDPINRRVYFVDAKPYWNPGRNLVVDKYRNIEFPFEPVDGLDDTGPFEFKTEVMMDINDYLCYITSTHAYQTAKDMGVELLSDNVREEFKRAWNEDGNAQKVATFPIYLRIGKVGK